MSTHEQAMAALDRANMIREHRKQIRASWKQMGEKESREDFSFFILDPPWWAENWRVSQCLRHLPALGLERIAKIMDRFEIRENDRLGTLSINKARQLAAWARGEL